MPPEKTPWLDIRPNLIDENIDKFIAFLRNPGEEDVEPSMQIFRSRIQSLLQKISSTPVGRLDAIGTQHRELFIRLLGAYLLTEETKFSRRECFVALLLLLATLQPDSQYCLKLLTLALGVYRRDGMTFSSHFSWEDIASFDIEALSKKIIKRGLSGKNASFRQRVGESEIVVESDLLAIYSSAQGGHNTSVAENKVKVYAEKENKKTYLSQKENLTSADIQLMAKALFLYQKNVRDPRKRQEYLETGRLLSVLAGDNASAPIFAFYSGYIDRLLLFAGEKYDEITPLDCPALGQASPDCIQKSAITALLCAYGHPENPILNQIEINSKDARLVKISCLIQACNSIREALPPSMVTLIRKRILEELKMDATEGDELDKEQGTFVGMEGPGVEFKTSFIWCAGSSQPDENAQKHEIYREICGFLNSELGGVLYLGVNDRGYVKGLDADLRHLGKLSGKEFDMDDYIRHIQDDMKTHFDQLVYSTIQLRSEYGGRVLSITVPPYYGGVVEIGQPPKAYIRWSNETVEMTDRLKSEVRRRRLADLSYLDNEIKAKLSSAMERKKMVVLKAYRPSDSEDLQDRTVEPFFLSPDDSYVTAFEPFSGRNRNFFLSRIGGVEIQAAAWKFEDRHTVRKLDIFHAGGDEEMDFTLEMDSLAHNILIEEYEGASQHEMEYNGETGMWTLNTRILDVTGAGRFYMSLPGHCRIVNGEAVKAWVREMKEQL